MARGNSCQRYMRLLFCTTVALLLCLADGRSFLPLDLDQGATEGIYPSTIFAHDDKLLVELAIPTLLEAETPLRSGIYLLDQTNTSWYVRLPFSADFKLVTPPTYRDIKRSLGTIVVHDICTRPLCARNSSVCLPIISWLPHCCHW